MSNNFETELRAYATTYVKNETKYIVKGDKLPNIKPMLERVFYDVYQRGRNVPEAVRVQIANDAKFAVEQAYLEKYK